MSDDIDIRTYDPENHEDWVQRLHAFIRAHGLRLWKDPEELRPIVERIIEQNPEQASLYRKGKRGLLGFFLQKVMAITRDGADPYIAKALVEELLKDSRT